MEEQWPKEYFSSSSLNVSVQTTGLNSLERNGGSFLLWDGLQRTLSFSFTFGS